MTLLDFDPDGEEKVLAAVCFAHLGVLRARGARRRVAPARPRRPRRAAARLRGRPPNRRHRPGPRLRAHRLPLRARHRLRRVPRPPAPPHAHRSSGSRSASRSATTCPTSSADAGLGERYVEAIGRAEDLYRSLLRRLPRAGVVRGGAGAPHPLRHADERPRGDAPHRAALGPQGHPAYRRVAQQMHRAIAEVAGHRASPRRCVRRPRLRPTSSGSRPSAGPSAAGACGKILQRIDQELPVVLPGQRAHRLLDDPTPGCVRYGAVPDARRR